VIAVIVPNYNGRNFIAPLCSALRAQTYNGAYEVLFVDNGSTDGSLDLLQAEAARHEHWRVLSYTEIQSSYAARNYGVSRTKAAFLVFTDVDCQPEPDWLAALNARYKQAGGPVLLSGPVDLFPTGADFNLCEWYDRLTALDQARYAAEATGATANLAVNRRLFEAVNGFLPVPSGGDREFCRRVMQLPEARFEYVPEARVRHPARGTVRDLCAKLSRVSRGKGQLAAMKSRGLAKWRFGLLQLVGLVLQPNQVRLIGRTFRTRGVLNVWSWRFALFAWGMGCYARAHLLAAFLRSVARPGVSPS